MATQSYPDKTLRFSLVSLATLVCVVGLCTFSFKKMMATYFYGMFVISGVILPDWSFFDRPFSQWFTPMPVDQDPQSSRPSRFKIYPMRLIVLTTIYGFGLYKLWMYIAS